MFCKAPLWLRTATEGRLVKKGEKHRVDDISQAVELEEKTRSWISEADEYEKWSKGPREAQKERQTPTYCFR